MATSRTRKRSRPRPQVLQKPSGVIHPRVQKVGPEHFGSILALVQAMEVAG